jgi:hypothetical protein
VIQTVQSFTDKATLLEHAKDANRFLTAADVTDATVQHANMKVSMALRTNGIQGTISTTEADYELLQMAAICFGLEKMCMDGKIRWSTGDIQSVTEVKFKTEYQKWQPMFFFAQGDSARLNNLLPHETWRMSAYKFVDSFIDSYHKERYHDELAIFHDDFRRGYKAESTQEHWRQY